jgi:hypothetical protein
VPSDGAHARPDPARRAVHGAGEKTVADPVSPGSSGPASRATGRHHGRRVCGCRGSAVSGPSEASA